MIHSSASISIGGKSFNNKGSCICSILILKLVLVKSAPSLIEGDNANFTSVEMKCKWVSLGAFQWESVRLVVRTWVSVRPCRPLDPSLSQVIQSLSHGALDPGTVEQTRTILKAGRDPRTHQSCLT